MKDYSKGKIYKIYSDKGPNIYIGSTIRGLGQRLQGHRNKYINNTLNETSSKLFYMYGIYDCKIELIKKYPCTTLKELHKEEGRCIMDNLNICVNQHVPGGNIIKKKLNYEKNKTKKILEYKNNLNYRNLIKSNTKKYRNDNREKVNKYFMDNPRKDYKKEWYDLNSNTINCECGGKYVECCLGRHEKTKRHTIYIIEQVLNSV